ncbi:hypothetical protein [Haloplanus vescus]|uniref:hypothetical protein n=1 Tax=Haloplanus vescus TaxID=555874 RepID=UPI0015A3A298|nr:hypothetical protein [Haloplanus vescus]
MLSKDFFWQVIRQRPSSTALHECRHCGYTMESDTGECPKCGSREIASYDLE